MMIATATPLRIGVLLKFLFMTFFLGSCAKVKRLGSTGSYERKYEHLEKIGSLEKGWSYKAHVPRFRRRRLKDMESLPIAAVPCHIIPAKAVNRSPIYGRNMTMLPDTIFVNHTNFKISLWDGGEIDGDSITLYLNSEPILEEFCLKKWHKNVRIEMKRGESGDVMLYALNTGTKGANTAAIKIVDGLKQYKLSLSSDLSRSQGITIKIRE
jgi:hypothetical protein